MVNEPYVVSDIHKKKPNNCLLINFQNGYLKEDRSVESECGIFRDKVRDSNTAIVCLNNAVYVGEEEDDYLCKTLLVSRNKKTGKVRVIEVGTASVKSVTEQHRINFNEVITSLELSRKFGSKKQKSIMEQREKLKINIGTVNEQMKESVQNTTISTEDVSSYMSNDIENFYTPPINRAAENVRNVYDLNDLLTKAQIETIMEELSSSEYESELLPFIAQKIKSGKGAKTETVLLYYLDSLIIFFTQPYKVIKAKAYKPCQFSNTLSDIILEKFTVTTNYGRTRSNQLKDKTLCYIIVILLLVSDFKFDLEDFVNIVKVPNKTLLNKVKLIGAYVVNEKNKKFAVLKLPLNTVNSGFSRRKSAKF